MMLLGLFPQERLVVGGRRVCKSHEPEAADEKSGISGTHLDRLTQLGQYFVESSGRDRRDSISKFESDTRMASRRWWTHVV